MFKIVSTIGPQSEKKKILKSIIEKSDLIRLNGAHNSFNWHKIIVKKIREINTKIPILIDLPGIKPRTSNLKDIFIRKNQVIKFVYKKKTPLNNKGGENINLSNPLPKIISKKFFTISDGNYNFLILKKKKNEIHAKSLQSYILKPKKGINFLNSFYDEKKQEKIYLKYLKIFSVLKPEAIGLSYIQTDKIINKIKKKYKKLIFVSKIENSAGLFNSELISKVSDIVMIDRGDLSAEVGSENLFSSIKVISKNVKSMGKPLIMATENLDSMIKNSNPSKSEVVALGLSIDLGADAIMLSEETAVSKNCIKILNWLNNYRKKIKIKLPYHNHKNIRETFVNNLINKIQSQTLIIFSKKGYAVDNIIKVNNSINIVLFTDNLQLAKISSLRQNICVIVTKKFDNNNLEKFIYDNIKFNKKVVFKNSKEVIILRVAYPTHNSRANNLSFVNYKDFK